MWPNSIFAECDRGQEKSRNAEKKLVGVPKRGLCMGDHTLRLMDSKG